MIKVIAVLLIALLTGCAEKIDQSRIPLTETELAYIASRPPVTWAVEENRPPYVFVENRRVYGLSHEYIYLISQKTGLKFRPISTGTFIESIAAVKAGQVEVITAIRPTLELAEFINFTPPFAYNGGVYLYRANSPPHSPLTTAIRKGGAASQYLVKRFPDMKIIEAIDDEEAVALLEKGLVDGAIMDTGSAMYFIDRSSIAMKWAQINFDFPYSFGYSKSDPMLGVILAKAVNSISAKEKNKLNDKWFREK